MYRGILVKEGIDKSGNIFKWRKICLPNSLIGQAIADIHAFGHPGINTLYALTKNLYHFPQMKMKVTEGREVRAIL